MPEPALLLERLDAIARSLAATGRARALLGLGSVGLETDRLDAFSDLDFFAIAKDGEKAGLIDDLSWLSSAHPIVFSFRNTVDGYKVLFADGVYGEFAVFETRELPEIPFAPGRVVWCEEGFDARVLAPRRRGSVEGRSTEWLVGEALTNLYVGLCREARGERLAGSRLVQGAAVDRVLELAERLRAEPAPHRDAFALERRAEARLPELAPELLRMAPGYGRSGEAALAILAWLRTRFGVNAALAAEVERLARRAGESLEAHDSRRSPYGLAADRQRTLIGREPDGS